MQKKWRVLLLDTKKNNPNHYICIALKKALAEHPLTEVIFKAEYGNAIELAKVNRCNLFIAFDGEQLDRGICARLAAICKTKIMWVTEDPYELSINKKNGDIFDLIFTNNSESVSAYGNKGRHLPFAADTSIHYREVVDNAQENKLYYDLFFAGNPWPNRVRLLKDLQSNLEELNVKVALPHNEHLPVPDIGMESSRYLWRTPNSEFVRFANKSRVTLTLHRSFSSSGNNDTAATPGPRLFEIALSGGFQLIDMSLPEVTKYFTEDVDFIGFRTKEECVEKLKFYLSNPEKRISIAKSAQQKAMKDHLYANRVDTIYKEIAQIDKKTDPDLLVKKSRPKILFVAHNVINVKPYGGVEVYQHLVMNSLKKDFEFFIYTADRNPDKCRKSYNLLDENLNIIESFDFEDYIAGKMLSHGNMESKFAEILTRLQIHLVHFQHLIGHVPSLLYIPKSLGIATIFSIHDYYAICHHFNLIGYQKRYCNIEKLSKFSCDICLNVQDGIAKGSQEIRRTFFGKGLEHINVLHSNTSGVANLFTNIFTNLVLKNPVRVFAVPMPPQDDKDKTLNSKKIRSVDPINIAIIGNFSHNKGADTFIRAIHQMQDVSVKFHIFGSVSKEYGDILDQLKITNLEMHGSYEAGSLYPKLQDMSLSLYLSNWPETFCISLSEGWYAGLVPIVCDIGALGERVIHGVNGFKIPVDEPGALVDIINRLVNNPDHIEEVRKNITSDCYVTNDQHNKWLSDLYIECIDNYSAIGRDIILNIPNAISNISLRDCGVLLNSNVWFETGNSLNVAFENRNFIRKKSKSFASNLFRCLKKQGMVPAIKFLVIEIKNRKKND